MQFTETSVSVKSINFIVPTYILKGAAPTSFSTRCKRVSRRIKRDKLLPRFPHFCYFIEQKSISQTQPYPVSFPVSNFFLFLPFLFFSLPFFFFFFYPPRSQQRGVVGEGRSGKIKRGEKSKREREREKEFLFLDDSSWAWQGIIFYGQTKGKAGWSIFSERESAIRRRETLALYRSFPFAWWPESTVWKGKAEGNRFHLSRTNDYQWVNDTQLAPTLVRKHTNVRTHRKLDVYPPTPTGDMYKNQ